jgi:hypothetical protein
MKRLIVALTGLLISSPAMSSVTLAEAEQAINDFTETSDFYIYGDGGWFAEPCSGEVEVDIQVFRFTVLKMNSQKHIDIQFDKTNGVATNGEEINVETITRDNKKRTLEIRFSARPDERSVPRPVILKIERGTENKKGDRKSKITLIDGKNKLECKGREN